MPALNTETGLWEYKDQIVDYDVDIDSGDTRNLGNDYFVIGENVRQHSFSTVADFKKIHFVEHVRDIPPELAADEYLMRQTRHLYPVIEKRKYDQVRIDAPEFLRDLYQQYRLIKPIWERTIKAFKECTQLDWNNDVLIERGKHRNKGGYIHEDKSSKRLGKIVNKMPFVQVIDMTTGETYMVKPEYCRVLLPLNKLSGEAACMDCRTTCNFTDLKWIIPFNRPICNRCIDYYQEIGQLPYGEDLINIQGPFEYDKSADNLEISDVR